MKLLIVVMRLIMYHCPFILAPSHVPLHILDSVAQAMTIRLLIDEASYAALHGFSHLVPIPINTSKRMGQGVFAPKSRPLGSIYSVGNQFFFPSNCHTYVAFALHSPLSTSDYHTL